jgi:thiol-disulfide isomerase/thioredoxin
MGIVRKWLILVLAGVAACSSAASGNGPAGKGALPRCHAQGIASVGDSAPDCVFHTLDGATLRLSELKGTPYVLNFWASWCPNCVQEMPALQKTSGEYAGRVRFLGADLLGVEGETTGAARAFAARFGVTYTSILDEGGLLYAHFSPRLFPPTTIFIDANGVIRYRKFGPMTPPEIRANLKKYLGVG